MLDERGQWLVKKSSEEMGKAKFIHIRNMSSILKIQNITYKIKRPCAKRVENTPHG